MLESHTAGLVSDVEARPEVLEKKGWSKIAAALVVPVLWCFGHDCFVL